jgi:hypothetical protein
VLCRTWSEQRYRRMELVVHVADTKKIRAKQNKNKLRSVSPRTIPTERPPLVCEVSANYCGYRASRSQRNGFHGRILGFLYRRRYFFFKVAPQLYSRDWVDSVPDSLLIRKSGSAENRTRTSRCVARNSDNQTAGAVKKIRD